MAVRTVELGRLSTARKLAGEGAAGAGERAEDSPALQAHIRGETAPFSADTLNDTVELVHSLARECTLVDREVSKYWLTEFFSRQLKEGPHRKYPATMLAWIRGVRSLTCGTQTLCCLCYLWERL